MKIQIAIFLFLATICFSCKKTRDDLLPQGKSQMYCQAILNTDSTIKVYVGKTSGVLNKEPIYVDGAKVLLYQNDSLIDNLSFDKNGVYTSFFTPKCGNKYKIEVIKDITIYGETTIPDTVQVIDPRFEYPTGYYAPNQETFGDLSFYIDDNPNVENFYELLFFTKQYHETYHKTNYFFYNNTYYVIVPDNIVKNEGDWESDPTSIFFSDKLFNGKKQKFVFSTVSAIRGKDNRSGVLYPTLEKYGYVMCRSVSKEYYLYRKFYTRHNYNSTVHSDGIKNLLFIGEPLDMYSNINGGLGVVAGFSPTTAKIKKK